MIIAGTLCQVVCHFFGQQECQQPDDDLSQFDPHTTSQSGDTVNSQQCAALGDSLSLLMCHLLARLMTDGF